MAEKLSTVNIEPLLKKVEKPGRYTGGEYNQVRKDHKGLSATFAFAFPDLYEIGMSYVGMQILYGIINRQEDLVCERVFAPASDMETLMREKKIPLHSLETKTPLKEFDVVGFTLQYEMSFTNVLNMLDLAEIPLHWEDRGEEDPLIIAGGPCAFNPEPLCDFVDVFLVGDGEELLPAFLRLTGEIRDRETLLKKAAEMEGVYVPRFYEPSYNEDNTLKAMEKTWEGAPDRVQKALLEDIESIPFPDSPIVPFIEVVQDRAVVEIFRGCTRGCRFCQAGMLYRPIRERKADSIVNLAKAITKNTGHDEMTLLSLSTSDYSDFTEMTTELMEVCAGRNVALSLPSLRLDSFSFKVLSEIQKYRKTGLTFAPEAGTQRLRNIINKNITEEDIYGSVKQAIELGWTHIKLYFMMGLPGETMEDLLGIAAIAKNVMDISRASEVRSKGRFSVTVSVSNFVPKPHTPFQWAPQDEDFSEKHAYLLEHMKIKGVSFKYHDSPLSRLEAVFARGDRRCGYFLEQAYKNGCRFDSWSEQFRQEGWQAAETAFAEKYGFSTDWYRVRQRSFEEVLPWDHIDCGVTKEYLKREMQTAEKGQTTPDCREKCMGCGINKRTECKWGGCHA